MVWVIGGTELSDLKIETEKMKMEMCSNPLTYQIREKYTLMGIVGHSLALSKITQYQLVSNTYRVTTTVANGQYVGKEAFAKIVSVPWNSGELQ
ncbi:hypothetical protein JTE90_012773 [Oedothorax gibbosus]|uniref:Uncharacterized protein n=1 Tax=Oedothorax gibbosus TaxID=931172 RepID=A0AAV6VYI4_9ARAC|nr:hypothetical protein JTE90_012773 [Oedothorax gibbosus]